MDRYQHGEVELVYEVSGGGGDPLVLIHGGWEDRHLWDRAAVGLAGSLQVLTYDRRGHGESRGPSRRLPVQEDAGDLAGLLEETGLYPAHLAALGMGGAVALRLAVDRPELVRSVALHEPMYTGLLGPGDGPPAVEVQERLVAVGREVRAGRAERGAREYLQLIGLGAGTADPPGVLQPRHLALAASAWLEEMEDPESTVPPTVGLDGVAVPVLATCGEGSPWFAATIAERLRTRLPNAHVQSLRGAGHYAPVLDPDLYVAILGTFLLERNVPTT